MNDRDIGILTSKIFKLIKSEDLKHEEKHTLAKVLDIIWKYRISKER